MSSGPCGPPNDTMRTESKGKKGVYSLNLPVINLPFSAEKRECRPGGAPAGANKETPGLTPGRRSLRLDRTPIYSS